MTIERFRDFCLSLSGAYPDFPFDETTMTIKVGRSGRGRMFALADVDGTPPRVNLKCEPNLARDLRAAYPASVTAGYHMNKEHWNTVLIEGELGESMIERMIVHSYELVVAGLPKKERP